MPKKIITKKNSARAKRILIAEDEPALRLLMQHQFVVHGFDVVAVDNGKDAFLQLQEETFDAAILDILMPKMDGLEVLKALCKQKRAHMVPIFVFSNLAQEVDVKTAKKYGIVEYVIKADVAIDEVVAKIEKHLKKQT